MLEIALQFRNPIEYTFPFVPVPLLKDPHMLPDTFWRVFLCFKFLFKCPQQSNVKNLHKNNTEVIILELIHVEIRHYSGYTFQIILKRGKEECALTTTFLGFSLTV